MNSAPPQEAENGREPSSQAPFRFCLLGDPLIARAKEDLPLPPHRTLALLAALLLDAHPHRRERLAGVLFPSVSE